MITWKCIISISAEELSSVIILYTKFFSLCSLFWRFGFWYSALYIIGWIVLSTLFPQPWYRGPTKVIELTGSTFRERVLLKQAKSTPKIQEVNEDEEEIKYWVVMLYANWSVACLNFESVLAKLSVEYSAPHIKFAKIDVDIYSDLAEEYGVSKDPASFDLPTLVLFHQGKEIRRLPELTVTKEGQTTSKADAAKNTITRLGWNKKPSTIKNAFLLEKIKREKKHQ
ncbi:hypothetical protein G6F57_006518 [Rhizopus arrhizus]|uniref:Thioredoxin domain-containing protein n=1 Tax=Rhizopus oryzae TaxID=64495 RepID=A0A9P6X9F1_RHIOR|nr:hypothetical protein G6F24_007116 [Rhizopus arrhizus]KAG1411039.1 hypothetical protein G6F58_008778 [Rhizopus delemar]KAG0782853.1 hypothetical protein G6F21_010878 [Rhizopus arrhizus]KAG0814512.1 hypothetical protein G6F20_004721 [Rhizopus arrhizus]KAG0834663.1 hypothetical protein G6F19_005092 [Rhizopus arrhizus]